MLGDDEVDPLGDPLAAIGNDPLTFNGYHSDSSSSSYSLSIVPAGLSVHRIPAFPAQRQLSDSIVTEMPKKRGRKKGSKNKFKRGIPIETWQQCGMQFNKGSLTITKVGDSGRVEFEQNVSPLAMRNSSVDENGRVKRKYTKRIKDVYEPQTYHKFAMRSAEMVLPALSADPSSQLILELDPALFYPDDPFPRDFKVRRKRKHIASGVLLPFSCDICRKDFKCVKGMQTHKSVKHGVEDLSTYYPCECCEQVFFLKRDLSQHVSEHRDTRGLLPCPAPGCAAREADAPGLVRHKALRHPYLGTLGRTWFHTWGDR